MCDELESVLEKDRVNLNKNKNIARFFEKNVHQKIPNTEGVCYR